MSEEKIKQDVVDEEISEPTEATPEQSEAQNAEESVVDASEVLEELKGAAEGFKTIIEFLTHVENVKEEIEKNKIIKDGVILSTIHGVKGMEFKNVFIINCVEETIPHKSSIEDNLEEERRLFYGAKRWLEIA